MYLHEALKEPDREKFIEAMEKEIAQKSNAECTP
jgi:hypothetical protein